ERQHVRHGRERDDGREPAAAEHREHEREWKLRGEILQPEVREELEAPPETRRERGERHGDEDDGREDREAVRVSERRRALAPSHAEARNDRKNAAGSSPRSRTSTSAEPTMTPSTWRPISSTCARSRTPKPAQTGLSEAAFTAPR